MPSVYLAGPDVFLAEARAVGARKIALCAEAGLDGLYPLDAELKLGGLPSGEQAEAIYRSNLALMDRADAIIANMTPFRGPGMDAGTAFEIGYMAARGRPVFAYSSDCGDYRRRVAQTRWAEAGASHDRDGFEIEDFGLCDNLMMACAAHLSAPIALRPATGATPADKLAAFEAFQLCLNAAAARLSAGRLGQGA